MVEKRRILCQQSNTYERYLPTNHQRTLASHHRLSRGMIAHHKRSRGDMVKLIEGSSSSAVPVRSDIGSNISSSCARVDNTSIQEYNKENEDPNAVTSLLLQQKNTRASAPLPTNITHNRGTLITTTTNIKHNLKSRDFTMNTLLGKIHKSTY